jgi:hypothetical protein
LWPRSPVHVIILGGRRGLLPTLIDILLLNFIQITNIFKMALDLVIITLKRMVVHIILGLTSFRVGIAVGWDRILIPS